MNLLLLSNHQSATGHKALAFVIEALGLKGQAGGYIGSEPDPEGGFLPGNTGVLSRPWHRSQHLPGF